MKVWLASTSDIGGAGRAAGRIYQKLRFRIDQAILSVAHTGTGLPDYIAVTSRYQKLSFKVREYLQALPGKIIKSSPDDLFNANLVSSNQVNLINNSDVDLVNLFWICNYLSIKDIKKINKRIVWRFSDLWPITYGYHYDKELIDSNDWIEYRQNLSSPRRAFLDWKLSQIPQDITVICPSQWLQHLVKSARYFEEEKVILLQTGIDTEFFKPLDRKSARDFLGIQEDDFVLLVGAVGGDSDGRKGVKEIRSIVKLLKKSNLSIKVIGFGRANIRDPDITWFGEVNSDYFLRILYNAADLYFHGAQYDNFPQTVLESLSSGCPVVAFRSSGASEAVVDKQSGLTLKPEKNLEENFEDIRSVINSRQLLIQMRSKSRELCVKKYCINNFIESLVSIYEKSI